MTEHPFWKLGLVGNPIAHSLSPRIHRAALENAGLRGVYALHEVQASGLDDILDSLRNRDIHGLNVTVPFKQLVLRKCDRLGPVAEVSGAVNTLALKGDELIGYNTDVIGLEQALVDQWPTRPWRGRSCTIYGAGGAARAAGIALFNLGAGELRITNRTRHRALELASTLADRVGIPCRSVEEMEAFDGSSLVIQATTQGVEDDQADRIVKHAAKLMERTAPDCVAMDLVYAPSLPPFARGARMAGRQSIGGLPMLVNQARQSFTIWTGKDVPASCLAPALK